jgi:iron complex outermembrane recepter protein
MQGVAAQDGATAQLEEVVVTARKRAESLQDVPVAVDAFSETKN